MIRRFFLASAAIALVASAADAGFPHRRAGLPLDPGCAAEMPALDPSCGFEPGCGPETVCPTNPCIKYRHKHAHRHKHCGCCQEPTYETVLEACSPETGLNVAIPVCLPVCCQGCPCEKSRCTILGCGQVRFDYACGCSVVARFTKHGDILVTYVGF